ncbi:MAG: reductive dehalogenase [Deltaproteobacteria bacterium]|nr:reductive dehalogenase [Deltaproteobacteria bacterium]
MIRVLVIVGAVGLTLQAFIGLSFLISCLQEKETRASMFALIQFVFMSLFLAVYLILVWTGFFGTAMGISILIAGYIVVGIASLLLFKKNKPNQKALEGTKGLIVGDVKRFDERETVFSRTGSLRPGSEQYETFYREHPEYQAVDDARRAKGGPMGDLGAIDRPHGDINVAMLMASSNLPFYLADPDKVKPQPHFSFKKGLTVKKTTISPEEASERIKGYAKMLGAGLVGIANLNPFWVYSHYGRITRDNWEDWGKEVPITHQYAVVFAEEMSFEMIGPAPHTPTSVESMHNYAKGAFIAVQVASFIANLGYSATANHFRYYENLMVPLAVDAGLGEIGRMGYLITKEFGPRVRLSAVTTDMPLIPDKPVDIGVEDFCGFCKKCAVCCPSQSIPMKDRSEVNGTLRWKLNEQSCYDYWGKIGTDCNVCMRVCPWSHARTFPHRLIVAMITRNALARRLFYIMDDIFYGKKPRSKEGPEWARYKSH